MSKRYAYNRVNAFTKGLATISSIAYFLATIVFVALLGVRYLPQFNNLIDFSELEFVVGKIFLQLDAFLIIGLVLSIIGFICSATATKALIREKGGFRGVILLIISIILIVFYILIITNGVTLGHLINYAFGGIMVVGILGVLLALLILHLRAKSRRQIERKIKKYEKNYLKFEKYNR